MNRNKIRTLVLVAGACLTHEALADKYFRGTSDEQWSNEANWSTDGCTSGSNADIPACDEHVIICANKTANVSGLSEALKVTVESGATLELNAELELCGNAVTSTINGDLDIYGSGILSLDWDGGILNTHTFAGSGQLTGKAAGAQITIESTGGLINEMYMHGEFEMTAPPEENAGDLFMYGGTIESDTSGGLLEINTHMVFDSESVDSFFLVTNTDSVLRFNDESCFTECACICLWRTYVELTEGQLDLRRCFRTRKTLTMWPGTFATTDSDAGGTFSYREECP